MMPDCHMAILRDLIRAVAAAPGHLLAQDCFLCASASGDALLCPACEADLPRLAGARCPVCALPTSQGEVCGDCLKDPPHFDATTAYFVYGFPVDRIIQALKYGYRLAVARYLGNMLSKSFRGYADVLVALPLHPLRLRERGFNQAVEIARPVARSLGLPLMLDAVVRDADRVPQASLPWSERRRNVRGAFRCMADLTGKRVLLVDDVMTTGATLDECAKSLKARGAVRVENLVVARTLPS
jgi:ComF family protein